jgi:4-hydroxybenzoate polyprenyltransferase/phosphoserine phosphatase
MSKEDVPLCVDLDGTLTPVDTLHESLLALLKKRPRALPALLRALPAGKAGFKNSVSALAPVDAALLPYNEELLSWLKTEKAAGRKLVLATASTAATAQAVARHLGLFDEIVASDTQRNLSGTAKRDVLVEKYGANGFDYAGNDHPDLAVWSAARSAVVVNATPTVRSAAETLGTVTRVIEPAGGGPRAWLRAMRLYQWVKNVLVFLPLVLAHQLMNPALLLKTVLAFVAFGLCASSAYLFNDLLDLDADRRHPRKRRRPFASGALGAASGLRAALAFVLVAGAIACWVGPLFAGVLACYYLLTMSYSFYLKRIVLVDVMLLSGLYTMRILAGCAAALIAPSFWLLAFSTFVFLCLAIVKRYSEIDQAQRSGKADVAGRGYQPGDLQLLSSLGAAAGYAAVMVLALYINSEQSIQLYRHPHALWAICPMLLFWISRVLLLTHRGRMHDDPIVFAIKDRVSLIIALLVLAAAVVATV